jgi:hypothetical protein
MFNFGGGMLTGTEIERQIKKGNIIPDVPPAALIRAWKKNIDQIYGRMTSTITTAITNNTFHNTLRGLVSMSITPTIGINIVARRIHHQE